MTSFYDCFDDVVQEMLAEFDCRSTSIYLVRHSSRTMNPVTRELDAGSTANLDVVGVTVPYKQTQIDGTTIQAKDIRLVIDSQQAPQADDDVVIDGDSFGIVDIKTFNAGGAVLGYDLQVRR